MLRSRQTRFTVSGASTQKSVAPANPRRKTLLIQCTGPAFDAHISFDRPTSGDPSDFVIAVGDILQWRYGDAPIETIWAGTAVAGNKTNIVILEGSEVQ